MPAAPAPTPTASPTRPETIAKGTFAPARDIMNLLQIILAAGERAARAPHPETAARVNPTARGKLQPVAFPCGERTSLFSHPNHPEGGAARLDFDRLPVGEPVPRFLVQPTGLFVLKVDPELPDWGELDLE